MVRLLFKKPLLLVVLQEDFLTFLFLILTVWQDFAKGFTLSREKNSSLPSSSSTADL